MCKWQLPNILIMDNFDLRKYLAENKLLKEETIDEIFGVAGRPRDRYLQRKKELSNQKNDKVTNYHDLLRYYQYAIAKVPRHKREKATNAQAMHDRYGQEIWDVLKTSYSDRELSDTPSPKFIDAANELIIAFGGESGNYRDKIHQPFYNMYQELDSEVEGDIMEDKVKGSNIKKVGDKWRVLSGKTGKMWKAEYDTKEDAEAGLRGYFASQNESLAERVIKRLKETK